MNLSQTVPGTTNKKNAEETPKKANTITRDGTDRDTVDHLLIDTNLPLSEVVQDLCNNSADPTPGNMC